jgi:cob(I)alamin adenosyltransferase
MQKATADWGGRSLKNEGRVIVYTGNGKGKTSAALGTVFRALGHGQRVCMLQFLKGKGEYGERIFSRTIEALEWHICGRGFVFNKEERDADREIARGGFELAREKVLSDAFDLIVFDEITYLPQYGFLEVEKIVELIESRPPRLNVVLTGRNADAEIIRIADTVTIMEAEKHAYNLGIKAQKGVEF